MNLQKKNSDEPMILPNPPRKRTLSAEAGPSSRFRVVCMPMSRLYTECGYAVDLYSIHYMFITAQ
jgi:hypothetical protein